MWSAKYREYWRCRGPKPRQSTISKSNASAAVSRAGSLARNSRSRSALMLESDSRCGRGRRRAFGRRQGAVTRSRTGWPRLRLSTSSTLPPPAPAARRKLVGLPQRHCEPGQVERGGIGRGQRLTQEAALGLHRRRRSQARPPLTASKGTDWRRGQRGRGAAGPWMRQEADRRHAGCGAEAEPGRLTHRAVGTAPRLPLPPRPAARPRPRQSPPPDPRCDPAWPSATAGFRP